MARIAFEVVEEEDWLGPCVQPTVDGVALSRLLGGAGGCGMWPEGLARVLLPPRGSRRRTQVLRCGCGDTGCDGATVEIVSRRREIVWRDFVVWMHKCTPPEELRFRRSEYVRALETLPPEAWEAPWRQPAFLAPGPPYLWQMIANGAPCEPVRVQSHLFEAVDRGEAEERAAILAPRYGLGPGSYSVGRIGTEFWELRQLDGW